MKEAITHWNHQYQDGEKSIGIRQDHIMRVTKSLQKGRKKNFKIRTQGMEKGCTDDLAWGIILLGYYIIILYYR